VPDGGRDAIELGVTATDAGPGEEDEAAQAASTVIATTANANQRKVGLIEYTIRRTVTLGEPVSFESRRSAAEAVR
jgi:hypothetical protein